MIDGRTRDSAGGPRGPGERERSLRRLDDETFDLLVIGGGATGAGIARDAILRGLTVALVDAGDLAGETSSHSSKLIHGGLRYLQYGDFGLVFEALTERRRLMTARRRLFARQPRAERASTRARDRPARLLHDGSFVHPPDLRRG